MSRRINKAISTWCVECDSRISLRIMPEMGDIITCHECGTQLEVVGLDPLELDWTDQEYLSQYDDFLDEVDFE
jgi:alpha-aminoadipate carrier protein LysW